MLVAGLPNVRLSAAVQKSFAPLVLLFCVAVANKDASADLLAHVNDVVGTPDIGSKSQRSVPSQVADARHSSVFELHGSADPFAAYPPFGARIHPDSKHVEHPLTPHFQKLHDPYPHGGPGVTYAPKHQKYYKPVHHEPKYYQYPEPYSYPYAEHSYPKYEPKYTPAKHKYPKYEKHQYPKYSEPEYHRPDHYVPQYDHEPHYEHQPHYEHEPHYEHLPHYEHVPEHGHPERLPIYAADVEPEAAPYGSGPVPFVVGHERVRAQFEPLPGKYAQEYPYTPVHVPHHEPALHTYTPVPHKEPGPYPPHHPLPDLPAPHKQGKSLDLFHLDPKPFIEAIARAYHDNEKHFGAQDRRGKYYKPEDDRKHVGFFPEHRGFVPERRGYLEKPSESAASASQARTVSSKPYSASVGSLYSLAGAGAYTSQLAASTDTEQAA